MEMKATNVARHELFRVKRSLIDRKKMDEKSRFAELSTEEIQEIMDKAVPDNNKKSHKVRDEII